MSNSNQEGRDYTTLPVEARLTAASGREAGAINPGSTWQSLRRGGVVPDVLAVERRRPRRQTTVGTATAPLTRMTIATQGTTLLRRANRIAIRHRMGEVVCIIEIVSPGNKASRSAVHALVEKTSDFLQAGVNVLLVDPFPPGPRDPDRCTSSFGTKSRKPPSKCPLANRSCWPRSAPGTIPLASPPWPIWSHFASEQQCRTCPPGSIPIRSSKCPWNGPINPPGTSVPPSTATSSNTDDCRRSEVLRVHMTAEVDGILQMTPFTYACCTWATRP